MSSGTISARESLVRCHRALPHRNLEAMDLRHSVDMKLGSVCILDLFGVYMYIIDVIYWCNLLDLVRDNA